jgi:3-phenylpropionate/trans-cinnamate dioxygenase ferredoxin reductase subunit
MRETDILIIGGGAAGTGAAETYRVSGGTGSVLIVSDESHTLYSRVLLPHAAKGKIDPEKAILKKAEWYAEKGIELLAGRGVTRVDYKRRVASLDDGEEISYAKLVIAVGAKPRAWRVPGADLEGVLRLQTYEDALALKASLTPESKLVIVGSGFIALEFAAAAIEKGAKAVILNRGPHFWTSVLGKATAAAVQAALEAKGVEVRNHAKVEAVLGEGRVSGVRLSDGTEIACDLVGLGIGVEPPMAPFGDLKGAHGLQADGALKAKHADVWVAGDCAEFEDATIGGLIHTVGNWTNAVAQGRHVGQALHGKEGEYATLTAYSSVVVPGAHLIFLGETKMLFQVEREEHVIEEGRKIVEFRKMGGRVIGAILLNAPDLRAEAAARFKS